MTDLRTRPLPDPKEMHPKHDSDHCNGQGHFIGWQQFVGYALALYSCLACGTSFGGERRALDEQEAA